MRITQNMMTRNYLALANNSSEKLSNSTNKFVNQRSFMYMSEKVTDGAKALRIRSQLYKNEQMIRNTNAVQEEFAVAETNLTEVSQILLDAHGLAIRIQNGTFEYTERDIQANEFEGQMKQILQTGNAIYGDHYVFSGTKNDELPFKLNEYNELTYNGARVTDVGKVVDFANFYVDPTTKQKFAGTWNEAGDEFTYKDNSGTTLILCTNPNYTDSSGLTTTLPTTPDGADKNGRYYTQLNPGDISKLPVTSNFYYQKVGNQIDLDDGSGGTVTYGLRRESDGTYSCLDNNGVTVRTITDEVVRNSTTYNTGEQPGNYIRDTKTGYFYEINKDSDPANPQYTDEYGIVRSVIPADQPRYNVEKVPYAENIYIDVGLGMNVTEKNGLDRNTTVQASVSGLEAYGFGTKTIEYATQGGLKTYEVPNNIYQIFGEMAKALKNNDMDYFGALDIHMVEQTDKLNKQIADIGVRDKYLTSNLTRLDNEHLTLSEMQANVEGINADEAYSEMTMNEYAWTLTLKFGSKYIPMSLMDYIN